MSKNNKKIKKVINLIVLTIIALVFAFPLIWMIASSFKHDAQIFSDINSLKAFCISSFDSNPFFNYSEVLSKLPLIKAMLNSFFYISIILVFSLLVNSMAGYAFARLKFPKRNLIFNVLLCLMIIPAQTVMLPQFSIINKLGWVNSYLGLIVPAIANPLYIFLFRQNFLGIPESIEEAAKLDGASPLRTFFQLIVPLAKPAYGTVAILGFIAYWNDFVWPVMVISDTSKQTVQMAMSTLFSIKPVNYGNVMAGLTFVTIPVLIIFFAMQKYYVAGIASTGSKN
ncbi:carbohydrate ABC transporter permease [Clostridium butyricum]|uniref:carbohydrate ABC transporter permease n=1 Tax=Clostridium butyricum TaxID=1492 RepID=UPI00232FF119|nr:carbohydrate ABC transporter permease [Clostridium butyricum]MDB2160167.1 carbohydrate ABC transporter permease [Clostridium butyricum]MDU4854499.1 carbohydrate ABC transporter permease [Clostridioides difficile]